jgi:TPR repeat protein
MHSVLQQIPALSYQWLGQAAKWATREWKQIRNLRIQAQAQAGNPQAQYRLSRLYESGELHPPTAHTSLQLLRQAAYSGVAAAQLQLAFKNKDGVGVLPNQIEAMIWFRKAAEMGNLEAQFEFGQGLALGTGGESDLAHGIRWLQRASAQGHAEAAKLLDRLTHSNSEELQVAA